MSTPAFFTKLPISRKLAVYCVYFWTVDYCVSMIEGVWQKLYLVHWMCRSQTSEKKNSRGNIPNRFLLFSLRVIGV